MADVGDTGDVTFEAPEEAGNYPYICTFPTHTHDDGRDGRRALKDDH